LMIEADGKVIHVDPWSQGNYEGLPKADFILITDVHGDHMDPKAIAAVRKDGTKIFAPPAVVEKMPGAAAMKNGATHSGGEFSFEAVPPQERVLPTSELRVEPPKAP